MFHVKHLIMKNLYYFKILQVKYYKRIITGIPPYQFYRKGSTCEFPFIIKMICILENFL